MSKSEPIKHHALRPTVNIKRIDDEQVERIERIDDLANRVDDVRGAEQVRGGFDPQPDPPGRMPVLQPPVLKPGLIRY